MIIVQVTVTLHTAHHYVSMLLQEIYGLHRKRRSGNVTNSKCLQETKLLVALRIPARSEKQWYNFRVIGNDFISEAIKVM